jgi:hypothetical protein
MTLQELKPQFLALSEEEKVQIARTYGVFECIDLVI